jgi:tripartite motif-containing protein 71
VLLVNLSNNNRHHHYQIQIRILYLNGTDNGQFYDSEGIAVDSSGNVYVADTNNNRIQKFDSNGRFLTTWGSKGSGNGQFDYPGDIAVDSSGNVYVDDINHDRVQKFNGNS